MKPFSRDGREVQETSAANLKDRPFNIQLKREGLHLLTIRGTESTSPVEVGFLAVDDAASTEMPPLLRLLHNTYRKLSDSSAVLNTLLLINLDSNIQISPCGKSLVLLH